MLAILLSTLLMADLTSAFGSGRSTCSSGRQCRTGICRKNTNIFCGVGSESSLHNNALRSGYNIDVQWIQNCNEKVDLEKVDFLSLFS